jgi:hypothetical protein
MTDASAVNPTRGVWDYVYGISAKNKCPGLTGAFFVFIGLWDYFINIILRVSVLPSVDKR